MPGGPDLFVICKNCQSEVSPYITECPYCGTRLRKRAPKLDRAGVPVEDLSSRRSRSRSPRAGRGARSPRRTEGPRLGRMRPGEIPGIRADTYSRPYATALIVVLAVLGLILVRAGLQDTGRLFVSGLGGASAFEDDQWRLVTYPFVTDSVSGLFLSLGAVGLFGWLLERRHGLWAPLLVFLLASAAGAAASVAIDPDVVLGGSAPGALGLLAAWVVWDLLARRGGEETDSDLLGVLVIACVVILSPIADPWMDPIAIVAGGLAGLLLGLPLARLHRG